MSKAVSGALVVSGLLGGLVSIYFANAIGEMRGTPSTDWLLNLGQGLFGLIAIVCVAAFGYGALMFSRGE